MKIYEVTYTVRGTGEEKIVFVKETHLERRRNGDIVYKLDEEAVSVWVSSRYQIRIRLYEIPDEALIQYGLMEAEKFQNRLQAVGYASGERGELPNG